MSGSRPSIFNEDLDLSGFSPKPEPERSPVPGETVRKVSEEGGFPSRSPRGALAPPPKRAALVKSGRTILLNARITQRAHDRFHEIVEAERLRYERGELMHRVTLGELVERALAALEREMGQVAEYEISTAQRRKASP
ncbi:hypothetical protein [Acidiphilium sp.]|uniref:hypothetical protein n=1 Tax=Acidiphilium sp. TaxID=527 RepID=UPI002583E6F9|nr:hypothetical protein [Acidiphilium sp.]